MPEEKLTIKEKAVKYDNWLKYVNNRGWSEILQEPLKVKKIIDKLKSDVRYLKELNNGLNQASDLLNKIKKELYEDVEKWKKSSDDFRKDLVESNKLHSKKALEIKELKQKLEKIRIECDKEPKAYILASFIKKILEEK